MAGFFSPAPIKTLLAESAIIFSEQSPPTLILAHASPLKLLPHSKNYNAYKHA